jgi:hypothetical protein
MTDAIKGMRRGAWSLAEVADAMREDLADGLEDDAVRLLFGFADDFRGSGDDAKAALIRDEPPPTGDLRFDAALAGEAEFFATEAGLPVPEWTTRPGRFAEPWWFVTSMQAFHAYVLSQTPVAFFRHGVFMAREVFDRA